MRLENRTTEKYVVSILGVDNPRHPTPEELGLPEFAENVQPCWRKEWDAEGVLIVHEVGYTYE